jgi:phosphatidylglycerophosphatase A
MASGQRLAQLVATAGGVGYAPIAPGSVGSAAGVGVFALLSPLHPLLFAVSIAALFALGVWAADQAELGFGCKDDSRIVIDEVVGQLLALSPLLFFATLSGTPRLALLTAGFALFRLFDIWKPGPAAWAERRFTRGAGVMLDDVAAGALAALALTPLAVFCAARVAS